MVDYCLFFISYHKRYTITGFCELKFFFLYFKARHRESVRKHKEQEKQKSKTNTTDDSNDHKQINTNTANDDAFWERLEELEKQELERGELER